MQISHNSHQAPNRPQTAAPTPGAPRKLGSGLTLLDKTLSFYVSQRGKNCFWGRVLNGCSIVVAEGMGTAGVTLGENRRHAFMYDPTYFESLTKANRRCTLVHEAVHVAMLHIPRFMRALAKAPDRETRRAIQAVFNLAADMEDNDTYVRLESDFEETLREGEYWILPENFDLPPRQTMETYVELMIRQLPKVAKKLQEHAQQQAEKKDQKNQNGGGGAPQPGGMPGGQRRSGRGNQQEDGPDMEDVLPGVVEAAHQYKDLVDQMLGDHKRLTGDNHAQWLKQLEELAEKDPAKLEQIAEQLVKDTGEILKQAYEATTKLRGTVPGGMQGQIEKMLVEPEVPWTELMRDWVLGNLGRTFTDTTRLPSNTLLNVDWVEPFPGTVFEPEVNVTWITDTSGSMSDDEFKKAIGNMSQLMAQTRAIRVHHIQVDTVIQNETAHDNSMQDDYDGTYGRYGYGGTRLEAAFARAVNIDLGAWREGVERVDDVRQPDLMVVFTDGYIEDMAPVLEKYHPGCPTLWLITHNGTTPPAVEALGMPHTAIRLKR